MHVISDGILVGAIATVCMDIWGAIVKYVLRLPTADWRMVGRWFGHMPRGVFLHTPISASPPIPNELTVGWAAHYLTGAVYGLGYLFIVQVLLSASPSFSSAIVFGLVTLSMPWLIMQPAMGAGIFASRLPRPGIVRMVNFSMHMVFGAALYFGYELVH